MIKDEIFSLLQYSYHIIGEMTAKKIEKKVNRENKRFYCRIFLSLLLLCNSFYGIAAWSKDSTAEHIYFLVMGGIIFLTGVNVWKSKWKYHAWNGWIAGSWYGLWITILVSNILENEPWKEISIVMLLGAGFLLCTWDQIPSRKALMDDILTAFEVFFGVIVIYCAICRPFKAGVCYNGYCKSREEFAIYAVFMMAVFMERIYEQMFRNTGQKLYEAVIWTGELLSVIYLVLSGYRTGYYASVCLVVLFTYLLIQGRKRRKKREKIHWGSFLAGCICTGIICMTTILLPDFLHTEVIYENESYMDSAVEEGDETSFIKFQEFHDKIYKEVKVENEIVKKFDILKIVILIPCVLLQMSMLIESVKRLRKSPIDGMDFFTAAVAVCFSYFCITTNLLENYLHPLWICYYLNCGYWFYEIRIEKRESHYEKIVSR